MNVIKPSTPMKAKPATTSELETECLYGETLEVLDRNKEWVFCKLLTDNYLGWVKTEDLGKFLKPTHRIIVTRSFLYESNSEKSNSIHYLPMGSQICVNEILGVWAKVFLNKDYKQEFGYITKKHLVTIDDKTQDWVAIAELLVGTPYKWGGRDTLGLDCSALLQLSYMTYGQILPRNTIDQIKCNKKIVTSLERLERGCIIFWKGHVGIMIDKLNCLHANAFHMKTIIEPLNEIILRMGDESPIIKMMNLN